MLYHRPAQNHIGLIMNEETNEIDMSMWFSTYGLLTAQRILERFNIHLANDELIIATKNPRSIYHQLLQVPLKNIFNGIILQQAHDYQVYAQKLFVDYLLSGEGNKEESSPGASTREVLENERLKLMEMGEEFNKLELAHETLISESQSSLIKLAKELQKSLQVTAKEIGQLLTSKQFKKEESVIQKAIRIAMIHYEKIDEEALAPSSAFWEKMAVVLGLELAPDLREQLATLLKTFGDPRAEIENMVANYTERAEDIGIKLRSYRTQFYDLILRSMELIKLLPEYHLDKEKDEENRSSLYFDSHIGE